MACPNRQRQNIAGNTGKRASVYSHLTSVISLGRYNVFNTYICYWLQQVCWRRRSWPCPFYSSGHALAASYMGKSVFSGRERVEDPYTPSQGCALGEGQLQPSLVCQHKLQDCHTFPVKDVILLFTCDHTSEAVTPNACLSSV